MGLSFVAMAAAALGYLPPLAGAVLQEVIDVLVIANALRALRAGGPVGAQGLSAAKAARQSAMNWFKSNIATSLPLLAVVRSDLLTDN